MAHKHDINFMRSVYRKCGLSRRQEEAFHDFLHSPAFDGNPNEMDFDMLVAACLEWKQTEGSDYDDKPQRGGGRSGQSSLDRDIERAKHRRENML